MKFIVPLSKSRNIKGIFSKNKYSITKKMYASEKKMYASLLYVQSDVRVWVIKIWK